MVIRINIYNTCNLQFELEQVLWVPLMCRYLFLGLGWRTVRILINECKVLGDDRTEKK